MDQEWTWTGSGPELDNNDEGNFSHILKVDQPQLYNHLNNARTHLYTEED